MSILHHPTVYNVSQQNKTKQYELSLVDPAGLTLAID